MAEIYDDCGWVSLDGGNSWRVRPEWRNIYSRTKINPMYYNKPIPIVVKVPEHIVNKLYGR